MTIEELKAQISALFPTLTTSVMTPGGDWSIKGFIDIYRQIYTISTDTKVLSKIIELMMFPVLHQFATERGFAVALPSHQNHYPDLTLAAHDGTRFAIDIKTTYRTGVGTVNGM